MQTTYDRIAHLLGAICLGFLGLSANPELYKHLPWWLIAAASVIGFAVQATTMPAVNRPAAVASQAVQDAVKARITGTGPVVVLLLGLSLFATSCATVQPVVKDVEACAGPVAADVAAKLVPAVELILECDAAAGFSPSALPACATDALFSLAVALGPDGWRIVGCITNAIEKDLSQPEGVRLRASAARKISAQRANGR